MAKELDQMISLRQLPPDSSLAAFAKAIVHDLRNPLSTIIGFADILSRDRQGMTEEQLDNIASGILEAGDQLEEMLKTISHWPLQDIGSR
ncbi:MAG: hypothetical protein FJ010_10270 [Chloroflexi bacterium]|nr:hypothetical protein [Chloroflexota bacterium]